MLESCCASKKHDKKLDFRWMWRLLSSIVILKKIYMWNSHWICNSLVTKILGANKLKRNLYRLKQAPNLWYWYFNVIKCFLKGANHRLYTKRDVDGSSIILELCVYDMLIAGKKISTLNVLKDELKSAFPTKDLGPGEHILSMRIKEW